MPRSGGPGHSAKPRAPTGCWPWAAAGWKLIDPVPNRPVSLRLVHDREHYELLVNRWIREARVAVWIATANVKDLHVEAPIGSRARARGRYRSIVTLFADLVQRGVEVRVLHAGTPSRSFDGARRGLDDAVSDGVELRQCPRIHFKMIAADGEHLYLGSANLTGAGLGAKSDTRRNFETGIVTDDEEMLDEMQARFDRIWSGGACAGCRIRAQCPAPLDGEAA